MSTILNTIQEVIRHELRSLRIAELGLVEAVYPHRQQDDAENYACDVRLKNSGLLLREVPVATGQIGLATIPNVGDLVVLTFDKGDINQPLLIGRLYNDVDRPPLSQPNQILFRLPLAESDDKTITADIHNFPDQKPPREISIALPPAILISIDDGNVRARAGSAEIHLDGGMQQVTISAGGTTVTLEEDGNLTLEAGGAMTLRAKGDLKLEAVGDLRLSGANLTLESRRKTEINAGTQAEFIATQGATVDGGLSATLQGFNTTIKGTTSFSP